jgi:hypothetical protein
VAFYTFALFILTGVLGGAPAPIIAIALLDRFGSRFAVAICVPAPLLVTLVAVAMARETAAVDLAADRPEDARDERAALRAVFP